MHGLCGQMPTCSVVKINLPAVYYGFLQPLPKASYGLEHYQIITVDDFVPALPAQNILQLS